jgi:polar amino acid transport system substrate-binding protein
MWKGSATRFLATSLVKACVALTLLLPVQSIPSFGQDSAAQASLAPGRKLKVALYAGTPTSILKDEGANSRGVGFELGREMAKRLGVEYEPIVFAKNADVLEAVQKGAADVAFTNASPARAQLMDFGPPYLDIELGYLAPADSTLQSLGDVDRPGRKIGVTLGSSSQGVLTRDLKQAQVIPSETCKIDAFATNKATLFEMAEKLPGSRVLNGHWGLERHAIAVPKGREAGLSFVRGFTRDARVEGIVAAAIARSGLRGALVSTSD